MPRSKTLSDDIEKLYYPIREVAAMVSQATSAIRYWDSEFDLKIKYNKKGDRFFTKADIDKIKVINYLMNTRYFQIRGAKQEIETKGWTKLYEEYVNYQ